MKIFDLHQDLMTHIRFGEEMKQTPQTSFEEISASELDLVCATAFPMPPGDDQLHTSVPTLISEEIQLYQDYVAAHPDWTTVTSAADLQLQKKKLLLHIEGLNVFDGSEDTWVQLEEWIDEGVRSVGTHWNIENQLGGGTLQPELPLTDLGREVIVFLEKHSVVLDLAHMGRQSFWDAVKICTRPLYVSHGNADSVCPNVRNYTDDQLKAIAETGGVIGVFFANTFVTGKAEGSMVDVVAHIDYIRNLIGIDHIAIGSDLGGIISGGITQLSRVSQIQNLFAALAERGYSESEMEAIGYKNAERVLQSHLGG